MLKLIQDLPGNLVGIKASRKVTKEDYETVMTPLLDKIHAEGKRVSFLYHFEDDFESFSLRAAWEDMVVGFKHVRLFQKCAVVGGAEWIKKSINLFAALSPFPVQYFDQSEYGSAIDWLGQESSSPIRHRILADKNVLVVEPDGPLDKKDFDTLALSVDPWIEAHGELRGLVIHVKAFPGWEDFGSVIRHIQFVGAHHDKIKKVALVADGALAKFAPKMTEHFISAEIEHFEFDDIDKAIDWATA